MATRNWVVHLIQDRDFPRVNNTVIVSAHQMRIEESYCLRFVAEDGSTEALFPLGHVLCVTKQQGDQDPRL